MRKLASWPLLLVVPAATLLTSCSSHTMGSQPGPNPTTVTPVISWPQPAAIVNPAPLGSEQLDATANVEGSFTYSPAAGTVLAPGTHTLSTTFTPTDTAHYTTATASVTLAVNVSAGAAAGPFVYVFTQPNGPVEGPEPAATILSYSVSADGRLSPVPGSHLTYGPGGVIAGSFLFALNTDGLHLDAYRIGPDGSLTKAQSLIDYAATRCTCYPQIPLLADRTGLNLYVGATDQDGYLSYETYSINQETGALTYVSATGNALNSIGVAFYPFTFSGSDLYAYGVFSRNSASPANQIGFLTRAADGSLSGDPATNAVVTGPTPPPGTIYEEALIGTDAANHVVSFIGSLDASGNPTSLPSRLASFTIHPDGSLTSTNTSANMPEVAVPAVGAALNPSATLLAVAGNGLQLFHFNGAAPLTPFTGMVTSDRIDHVAWDNHNHLFGVSPGKLYVFNVTADGVVQVPGSPYSIPQSLFIVVQPG